MKVTLLNHTPDPHRAVATAARICYSDCDIETLKTRLTPSKVQALIAKVVGAGHLSCLEHASFTFGVEGISRACSHQLVRHRVASFAQQSQRYVKAGEPKFAIPASIALYPSLAENYNVFVRAAFEFYEKLRELGVPAEDARFVLPNACETRLVVTMNARELLHFFALRCCRRAQWEIRDVANEMLKACKSVAPLLFDKAGMPCLHGSCPEGAMGCAKEE